MYQRISLFRLILREMQQSKFNTLLCFACVLLSTALIVAMATISRSSVDATRKQMKAMGFNLRITPKEADPARYQALDFQEADMPEDYIQKLAESKAPAQHFVGKYQKTVQLQGCTVVLTGIRAELTKVGTQKKPMPTAYTVSPGEVYLGYAAARALQVQAGDTLSILEKSFKIVRVLEEVGIIPDDIRIFADLHEVQQLLGKDGRINAIDALACYCPVDIDDILTFLTKTVHKILPDVTVTPYHSILLARQQQREMLYRLELIALAIVTAGAAIALWGLTHQNVRNRRREIGVLNALGVSRATIIRLFIGKILLYSTFGGVSGAFLGLLIGNIFNVTTTLVYPAGTTLIAIMLLPAFTAVLFGMPPILGGLLQAPASALGDREV